MQYYILAPWFSLLIFLLFAFPFWRRLVQRAYSRAGGWLVLALLLPYLIGVNFRPELAAVIQLGVYLGLPTILLAVRPKNAAALDPYRILAILSVWFPIEFDWLPELSVPLGTTGALLDVRLPVVKLTAVGLALFLFMIHHPIKEIGYTFKISRKDWPKAFVGLLAFGLIGIPIGLLSGFLHINVDFPGTGGLLLGLLGGYLLVALPEELLFRGIIQNLVTRQLPSEKLSLGIAAVVFGLSHLNNSTPGFPEPNWMYALMAGIAGAAYGWVWQRTNKVAVSALTHALVNLLWSLIFS